MNEKFELISNFKPSGDQPEAIEQLVRGVLENKKYQVLLGVTGSGKTFTIANVIAKLNRPTLVLSHNKTLAAQLYGEFKQFFPNNLVEYFISYYDYYQPEAYIPSQDKYIEKDLSINEQIEKLRISATSALLSGRRDVIVVASVSCLFGIGNPEDFHANISEFKVGQKITRNNFLRYLVDALYSRDDIEFSSGKFRVKGEIVDVFLAFGETCYRFIFWDDIIDEIFIIDPYTNQIVRKIETARIYPASVFMTTRPKLIKAIEEIKKDLEIEVNKFIAQGKLVEAQRLRERVSYDIEMLEELGYCKGIENYSRYFDGRPPGSRPFCLLDYFPDDFLTIVDESHVTLPQIRGMYGGDHSRKKTLVEYGFRLPAALDNRPLTFEEFEFMTNHIICMSATPGPYELVQTGGEIVEQVVRPTGLLDPIIEVRPTFNQIEDLLGEIKTIVKKNERVLVTTLTKKMAEDLTEFLKEMNIKTAYIHSDIDALERVEIIEALRNGKIDVLVGVNLLREGLDLPEVSLVAILDADKEGFLRSETSLTQTAGRAARNLNGKVIMYADKITESMKKTIDETNRRRKKQMEYNAKHNITPTQIKKTKHKIFDEYNSSENYEIALQIAENAALYMTKQQLKEAIDNARKKMEQAAEIYDFINAKIYRDEMFKLIDIYNQKYNTDAKQKH